MTCRSWQGTLHSPEHVPLGPATQTAHCWKKFGQNLGWFLRSVLLVRKGMSSLWVSWRHWKRECREQRVANGWKWWQVLMCRKVNFQESLPKNTAHRNAGASLWTLKICKIHVWVLQCFQYEHVHVYGPEYFKCELNSFWLTQGFDICKSLLALGVFLMACINSRCPFMNLKLKKKPTAF